MYFEDVMVGKWIACSLSPAVWRKKRGKVMIGGATKLVHQLSREFRWKCMLPMAN
jgi:hypothetical protein